MSQIFLKGIDKLNPLLKTLNAKKAFLVTDSSFPFLTIKSDVEAIPVPFVLFDKFSPNPLHDDADNGRALFFKEGCDVIIAIGGGSSMDVAKCIKLDSASTVPLIAIPTTAGTGSESTKHIVVYRDGKKESLGNPDVIPNYVILEPKTLKTLPLYQKKCTLFDALCQAIESYWSIHATFETRVLSKKAIKLIVKNMDEYILNNNEAVFSEIMEGANYSGQAINLTQTTAAHAMSYKLTSLYRLPHGHAVAVCLPNVWKSMLENKELLPLFNEIASLLGQPDALHAIDWFTEKMTEYDLKKPTALSDRNEEIEILTKSVNPVRLKNNPVQFTENELKKIYERIVL